MTAAFGGLYLERTLDRIDRRDAEALRDLTAAIRRDDALAPVLERLRSQGFTADQVAMLERSARELVRVDASLRRYVVPRLADRLEDEPDFSRLGGREVDVSVLFADLVGFTGFSGACPGRGHHDGQRSLGTCRADRRGRRGRLGRTVRG